MHCICTIPNIWTPLKHSCTHPQGVIIDYYQGKLVTFVNLVFGSDKHFNHLLANVQGIRFRPKWKNSEVTMMKNKTTEPEHQVY